MSINSSIPQKRFVYNNFPLHHTYDTTGRFGNLIPVDITEVAPGDFHKVSVELNMRLSPLSAPAMVRLNAHLHSFYVPFRIITPRNGQESTWEKFILSLNKPLTEVPWLPYFFTSDPTNADSKYFGVGSLWDYLTLPVMRHNELFNIPSTRDDAIIALPHLACLSIYDYWYRRDQIDPQIIFPLNLEGIDLSSFAATDYVMPEKPVNSDEEFDINKFVDQLLTLKSRNYERDYFTSALPEPQYGDDVTIGDSSDVYAAATGARLVGNASLFDTMIQDGSRTSSYAYFYDGGEGQSSLIQSTKGMTNADIGNSNAPSFPVAALGSYQGVLYPRPFAAGNTNSPTDQSPWVLSVNEAQLNIDSVSGLKSGFQVSVEQLRMAFQLQGVAEAINRGGTRYDEVMKSVYGVSIDDLRLQKPQYLGGIKVPLTIGAVLQTSESANTPQGTLTGQGGTISGGFLFKNKHMIKEHGYIVTFLSVTPRTSYTGGTRRLFRKFDPLDYYCQAFDHLGEQLTKKTELYDDFQGGVFGSRDEDFGYNPRYQEYKTRYSTSTGEFRTTLSNWVLTRSFNESPGLSPDFIRADSEDFDRLFIFENVENTSNEHFQVQLYFNWVAKRNMSKYSKPFTFY